MFETRIHGRGGQGVATAGALLSGSADRDGLEAQAFASFGSGRLGAPVVSYCRIDDAPIRVREPVLSPDAVMVLDATLLHHVDVFDGLRPGGVVLINSARSPRELGLDDLLDRCGHDHVVTVDATALARQHVGRPLPNVCLLGAFCALTGVVHLDLLEPTVRQHLPGATGAANARAARAAYELVRATVRA